MSDERHLKVYASSNNRRSYVELDGKRVKNCTGFSVHTDPTHGTSVTLELMNVEVHLEAEDATVYANDTTMDSVNKTVTRAIVPA